MLVHIPEIKGENPIRTIENPMTRRFPCHKYRVGKCPAFLSFSSQLCTRVSNAAPDLRFSSCLASEILRLLNTAEPAEVHSPWEASAEG
jgi:hypothetical protein